LSSLKNSLKPHLIASLMPALVSVPRMTDIWAVPLVSPRAKSDLPSRPLSAAPLGTKVEDDAVSQLSTQSCHPCQYWWNPLQSAADEEAELCSLQATDASSVGYSPGADPSSNPARPSDAPFEPTALVLTPVGYSDPSSNPARPSGAPPLEPTALVLTPVRYCTPCSTPSSSPASPPSAYRFTPGQPVNDAVRCSKGHNDWDIIEQKNGDLKLRCRRCREFVWRKKRSISKCPQLFSKDTLFCPKGCACDKTHIHRYRNEEKEDRHLEALQRRALANIHRSGGDTGKADFDGTIFGALTSAALPCVSLEP